MILFDIQLFILSALFQAVSIKQLHMLSTNWSKEPISRCRLHGWNKDGKIHKCARDM